MRTLGGAAWVNDYVGIPYVPCGRDWQGVDCYGLLKLVYRDEYNIDLPDWLVDPVDLRDVNKHIEDAVTSGQFTETDTPADGDIVVCYRTRAAHHIGVFVGGSVLHADKPNVVCEHLSKFKRRFVKVVIGEWTP